MPQKKENRRVANMNPEQLEKRRRRDRTRKHASVERKRRAREAKKHDDMLRTNAYFNKLKEEEQDAKK